MGKLISFGLIIAATCVTQIGPCALAETVTFSDENSLRALYHSAEDTLAYNRTDSMTARLTNYKESGMLFLDSVHPPDRELASRPDIETFNYYHLNYRDPFLSSRLFSGSAEICTIFTDRSCRVKVDPAIFPRFLESAGDHHVIQMTYDPNNDGVLVPFDLISIDVLHGSINVGVRGPFGIAVFNNLTAGPIDPFTGVPTGQTRWTLIGAAGLTRATLEGNGQGTYVVDNVVFQPDPASSGKVSVSETAQGQRRRAIPEELPGAPPPALTTKLRDFLHNVFVRRVAVDILPLECGDRIGSSGGSLSNETLKVAILGAADFDAAQIDPNSILLDGVAPRSVHFAHLPKARIPFAADRCALEEPHEFIDLVARFDLRELFDTVVGSPAIDDLRPLILSGQLRDGTRFEGSDAIIVPNQPTIPVGAEIRK